MMSHISLEPVLPDPDAVRVVDLMLDKKPIPDDLQTRYYAPEAVAARMARQEQQRAGDWPAVARYRAANQGISNPELVMIGDSGTEIWGLAMPDMFGDKINRGISGQTSSQILLRFIADVVDLKPRRVHILCGTNDIAGNTGHTTPEDYQRNIRAMVELARANQIEVLLASIPPAFSIFWKSEARPLEFIPTLNNWLRNFASENGATYIDYYSVLTDGDGALQERFSADGVHVTRVAYQLLSEILKQSVSA